MKVVYVAGPFRAANAWAMEQNIRRAEEIALKLWILGFAVICPHTNTRFFQGAARDETWLDGDLEFVRRSDALFMVPEWQKSVGATTERDLAVNLGIPVFEEYDAIMAWGDRASQ